MKRRDVLKLLGSAPLLRLGLGGTGGLLAMTSGQLYAAPQTDTRLFVVFMRGAYDCANLLVPISSDFYYESRPTIAIARPGQGEGSALPINADWGLHPFMQDSLLPMYKKKQLAFVNFAGTADLSRSHFETQNTIELGQALKGDRDLRSGFLNRLAQVLTANKAHPASFTRELPVMLTGGIDVPNIALVGKTLKSPINARQQALIQQLYQSSDMNRLVSEGFTARNASAEAIKNEMDQAGGDALSVSGFQGEARRIATLMREQYNIGFVDVGGWDTHVGQGGAKGALANRLDVLAKGLVSFSEGMGSAWKNTVVVVISEFGRTFRENGNKGTDHGHGTTYWVMGGAVNGGRIAGEQIKLGPTTLNQDRDYPVLNNYRDVFGGLFKRLYGLDDKQLQKIFAGAKAKDLALI